MTSTVQTIIAFTLYFGTMIGIGLFFMRRSSTSLNQYFLGGRGLNSWVAAISAQASDMSGWLLLGLPGTIYFYGLGEVWIGIGLAIGTILNWLFVAKRLRIYTEVAGDSMTLPEYFSNRFQDEKGILRIVSAIVIFVFFILYVASAFVAGGKLFSTVFTMEYTTALILTAVIVVLYTSLGGFLAVCWSDLIQGMLMFFAIIIIPVYAISSLGGWDAMIAPLSEMDGKFTNLFDSEITNYKTVLSGLAWGLGYLGMPHILVRFMAIKSPEMIKKSTIIASIWVVLSLCGAILVGIVGHAYLAPTVLDATTSETVFMLMINKMMPAFIGGFFLAAILAAIMSTADSQLLVVSSVITSDLMPIFTKNKEEKVGNKVLISRILLVVVAIVAIYIARDPNNSVMDIVGYAWSGLGAAFGPVVLLSLFWRRINIQGAVAGMITGAGVVLIWKNFLSSTGIYELLPGFFIALIVIIIVSLMTKEPSEKVTADFDKVQSMN